MIEKQAFHLLKNLGSHIKSYKDVEHAKKFYQTIMHSGLPGESITETTVRMHQKQKIKTSSTLISDEESIEQHLRKSDLQCFIWKRCMKQNMIIPKLVLENNYFQVLLREKLESNLIIKIVNMQINMMLLMMVMLMMTMIIYQGKKAYVLFYLVTSSNTF